MEAYFRDNTKVKELTEEEIFKKPTNKKWAPHYRNFCRSNKKWNQRWAQNYTSMQVHQPIQKKPKSIRRTKTQRRYCHNKRWQRRCSSHTWCKDYIKESERQLNGTEHYRHLQHDPTTENNATVNKVITRFKNDKLISNNASYALKVESPRTPRFYIQAKIYKEENPGRPVVSFLNSCTSKTSEYVDFHLRPIVKQIPSFVKDTTDFLCKLDPIKSVPDNAYLVSLDVKSLYTSIQTKKGIKAVKKSFDKHTSRNVATKIVTTLLALILTLNNFVFNCKHYFQIKGCAMGTICPPSYANIFIDHFDKKYIYTLSFKYFH